MQKNYVEYGRRLEKMNGKIKAECRVQGWHLALGKALDSSGQRPWPELAIFCAGTARWRKIAV
jgi:hypothetical protein